MVDGEGSVITDGQDAEDAQNENSEASENSANINNSATDTENQDTKTENGGNTSVKTEEGKDKNLTEKGTKLAEDPLQAANQLRANAEAKAKKYEEFFSDPKNVEAYLNDLKGAKPVEKTDGKTDQISELSESDIDQLASKVETAEDVKNVIKAIVNYSKAEINKIRNEVQGITNSSKIKETNQNVASEIQTVQQKYPQLQKELPDGTPNPEFDKDLDDAIGKMFLRLDFDPRTKSFKGQTSILEVADIIMKAAKVSESKGSRKAQTIVQDRRGGRVIAGGANTGSGKVDESKMSPSQTIAQRINRLSKRS